VQPLRPFAALSDPAESLVVVPPGGLEERAQVKQGGWENGALDEKECDQEPADAPVPIQKRMDRLELGVNQRDVNHRRQGSIVQELLPISQAGHQLCRRRGNVGCVCQGGPGRPDPVLRSAKLTGSRSVTPNAPHQLLVELPHEPEGERECLETLAPVLEGDYVVPHLAEVGGTALDNNPGLGREQFAQSGLGPFDPA